MALAAVQSLAAAHPYAVAAGAVVVASVALLKSRPKKPKFEHKRTPYCASSSPFVLKLECFLRMAKIPYEFVPFERMSKKGKIPFIVHNGVETADSSFCIEYLKKAFPEHTKPLEGKSVDPAAAALSRAIKVMVEENTYFAMMYTTWAEHGPFEACRVLNIKFPFPANLFVPKLIANGLRKNLHGQGMGRHSPAEVHAIGIKDFEALSALLGDKKFIMGSSPTELDATVFGFVQMAVVAPFDSPIKARVRQLDNLVAYAKRMRELYWPDWDSLLLKVKA